MLRFFNDRKGSTILQKQPVVAKPRLRWYTTTDYLPVRNFYKVTETGDLRWLLKGIDYEQMPDVTIDLTEVWDQIFNEFVALSKDRDYELYLDNLRKLAKTENKYETLKSELFTLYFRYNKEYADDLEAENITLNLTTREYYLKSLDVAARRLDQYLTKIKLLEKELKAREVKSDVQFEDLVFMVERYQGFPLDIDKVSIKRFVLILNRIKEENGKRKN
jgi:hypothetical protein